MIPLDEYHTLGLPVSTSALFLPSEEEIPEIACSATYIIGEGSNILPLGNLPPILCTRAIKGYQILRESISEVEVEVAAGENWDAWVRFCIAHGWHGLENLAAIPGTVGAAVVQNIGAYGVELAPFLVKVRGWNKRLEAWQELPAHTCKLSYRHSIFQEKGWQDDFIITRVTLRLKKSFEPVLTYPDVRKRVDKVRSHDPWYLYQVIRAIRSEKLPAQGSAGSFFKNPILSEAELQRLQQQAPEIPFYSMPDGSFKVPAAWLIDRAGLKGYRIGDAEVYEKQPLVLVNRGKATPNEFLALAREVQRIVWERWGIRLEPEVRFLEAQKTA
ncbi:MAG: UDP-N-acetylmuramate dehydrogenase [Bacteroidia bacterium]|nr:UDP-N-acetylmuramate dehydrogenase [Bacteroidia bacterium]MDW8015089.1 UDP-N-acetylmuramate dehydrogenase [Bacteroidia bacterium]